MVLDWELWPYRTTRCVRIESKVSLIINSMLLKHRINWGDSYWKIKELPPNEKFESTSYLMETFIFHLGCQQLMLFLTQIRWSYSQHSTFTAEAHQEWHFQICKVLNESIFSYLSSIGKSMIRVLWKEYSRTLSWNSISLQNDSNSLRAWYKDWLMVSDPRVEITIGSISWTGEQFSYRRV